MTKHPFSESCPFLSSISLDVGSLFLGCWITLPLAGFWGPLHMDVGCISLGSILNHYPSVYISLLMLDLSFSLDVGPLAGFSIHLQFNSMLIPRRPLGCWENLKIVTIIGLKYWTPSQTVFKLMLPLSQMLY